ncbi:hypothetical protein T492DRAFT_993166, partial [Pavlovales sp. CCMP2436]
MARVPRSSSANKGAQGLIHSGPSKGGASPSPRGALGTLSTPRALAVSAAVFLLVGLYLARLPLERRASVLRSHRPCSDAYAQMPAACQPRVCGSAVIDNFASPTEVSALRAIASAGMAHGGGTGGPTVLDLVSGALSLGEQFISIYSKLNSSGAAPIASEQQLRVYELLVQRVRETASGLFGASGLELASPTFWSRLDAAQPPRTTHDQYWHPHLDTEQYQSFTYTALLYLSDHGSDFTGGLFEFVDEPKERRTVLPAKGRLLVFTSGAENKHRVTRLRTGERLALTIPFTCDPAAAVGPGWLGEARASLRR